MKVRAEFQNDGCRLVLTPTDDWEKALLGAVAKGGESLSAVVTYSPEGHFTHRKCSAVSVILQADGRQEAA